MIFSCNCFNIWAIENIFVYFLIIQQMRVQTELIQIIFAVWTQNIVFCKMWSPMQLAWHMTPVPLKKSLDNLRNFYLFVLSIFHCIFQFLHKAIGSIHSPIIFHMINIFSFNLFIGDIDWSKLTQSLPIHYNFKKTIVKRLCSIRQQTPNIVLVCITIIDDYYLFYGICIKMEERI